MVQVMPMQRPSLLTTPPQSDRACLRSRAEVVIAYMESRMSARRKKSSFRTYDEFFVGATRVTTVQFCGLLILGVSLIGIGFTIAFAIIPRFAGTSPGFFEGLVLFLVLGISGSFVYLGIMHLRRAFAGRR